MAVKPNWWAGKRVLITGHTGFKGSWLSLLMQSLGAVVYGYAIPPETSPSLFGVAAVAMNMQSKLGDVRNLDALMDAVRYSRPEVLFHLAAKSLVRPSYRQPVDTYATNVMGTAHILEAARLIGGVRAIVVVTSDKCYQNDERDAGYREGEPMGGFDPYSSSKGCAELVTAAYRNSFFSNRDFSNHGTAIATARAGNVIGGGDWATDRLVPDIMTALMEGRVPLIRSPHATRPWQHVLECLAGYVQLAERLWVEGSGFAEAWNFGPLETDDRPVAWLADRITELWGEGSTWKVEKSPNHLHEALALRLDSSKARGRLGWAPRLNLSEAIEWTVDWYKAYCDGKNMSEVTRLQIERYQKLCVA